MNIYAESGNFCIFYIVEGVAGSFIFRTLSPFGYFFL